MSAVLEARAVITAEDKTGKAFDSLKARIAAITKQTEAMDRAMGAVGKVAKDVEGFKPLPGSAVGDMSKLAETVTRVDKAMADVNRSAAAVAGNVGKTSAEVVGLSGKLMDAGAKLKGISDFRATSRGVQEAALALRKAQQDERLLAAKIDGAPNPARSMQAAHAAALAEIRATEKALQAQVAAAATARTSLGELGVPVNRLASEEERLKSVLDGTNAALLRQIELERQGAAAAEKAAAAQRLSAEQEARHHKALLARFAAEDRARHAVAAHAGGHQDHGFVNYALTSAAMAVSAHEIGHVIAEGWHEGAELQHERMQLKNAGRTPEEMREMEAAGRSAISELPTANFTETMKVMAETTSAFGSVHHAIDNLPFMMKSMSVLKSAGGSHIHGDAAEVGQAFAKTFEERQTKAEDFQEEASAMIPAMVATGGLFNPQELYAFAQQAKSALPNYSMRFLSKIAPSLITAQGGERAGTAANAFNSIVMGKVNDKKQTEAWERYGLLDDSKVLKKAGHAVSWTAGAVKDTDLALTDPLEWAEKVVLPAMRDKGVDVDNRLELAKVLGTMFRNQNGNMFANEIMQAASRARLHKDEGLYNKTGDLDTIYKNDLGEFNVAAGALGDSLKTLGAAATAPMMHRVGESLSWLAGALNQVSAFGLRHPTVAATAGVTAAGGALAAAGWIGKKLWDGFGLKGSALALTGSAEALTVAAGRLGMAGHLPGGGGPGGVAGRAAGAAETAAEGAGAGGVASRVANGGPGVAGAIEAAPEIVIPGAVTIGSAAIAGGIAVATIGLVKASVEAQEPGKGGQWAPPTMATEEADKQHLDDEDAEAEDLRNQITRIQARSKLGPGLEPPELLHLRDRLADLENQANLRRKRLDDLHAYHDREAERGRALVAMPRPDDQPAPYVDREAERGRAFAALPKPEEFGPTREEFGPGLSPELARRYRYAEQELDRSRALAATSKAEALDSTLDFGDEVGPPQHGHIHIFGPPDPDPVANRVGKALPKPSIDVPPVPRTAEAAAPSLMRAYDVPPVPRTAEAAAPSLMRVYEVPPVPRTAEAAAPSLMRVYEVPPVPRTAEAAAPSLMRVYDVPPVPRTAEAAPPSLMRAYDGAPPLARSSGPVPVQIVGTSTEHMPTRMLPPGMHPDFTLGNNSGGFGSPGMGADDHLGPMPRRGPNLSMVDAQPVEPHVDDSALVALDHKLTETAQHAQALGATPIAIHADAGSIENMIALLTRAISLKAQLGSTMPGGGTSGAVGTSYPQTAPTGRNGGGR